MYGKLQESWQLTMLCEQKNEKKANILTVVYYVDGRKKTTLLKGVKIK